MKKPFLLIIMGIVIGSTTTYAVSTLFSDVPANSWYSEAVMNLTDKGIIEGYQDGTFGPSNNVNRAELAVTLNRLIEYLETGSVTSTSDVNTGGDTCFTMFDGNCYYPGEWVPETDCQVSATGNCEPMNQ